MGKSKLLFSQKIQLFDGRFEARIVVYEVSKSKRFPDGVKLSCVLLDLDQGLPRLLLDNHAPYGYHLHTEMPHNKAVRAQLNINNYEEAIDFFMNEALKVVQNEK